MLKKSSTSNKRISAQSVKCNRATRKIKRASKSTTTSTDTTNFTSSVIRTTTPCDTAAATAAVDATQATLSAINTTLHLVQLVKRLIAVQFSVPRSFCPDDSRECFKCHWLYYWTHLTIKTTNPANAVFNWLSAIAGKVLLSKAKLPQPPRILLAQFKITTINTVIAYAKLKLTFNAIQDYFKRNWRVLFWEQLKITCSAILHTTSTTIEGLIQAKLENIL